eukprot:5463329-Prymnesium_polylepis.2
MVARSRRSPGAVSPVTTRRIVTSSRRAALSTRCGTWGGSMLTAGVMWSCFLSRMPMGRSANRKPSLVGQRCGATVRNRQIQPAHLKFGRIDEAVRLVERARPWPTSIEAYQDMMDDETRPVKFTDKGDRNVVLYNFFKMAFSLEDLGDV